MENDNLPGFASRTVAEAGGSGMPLRSGWPVDWYHRRSRARRLGVGIDPSASSAPEFS